MSQWKLVTTSPFEVVAQCPNCGMYYKVFWKYIAANAQIGSLMFCSGYFNTPGCQRFSELSYPMPFDMQIYLEFSKYINPGMIPLSTPIVQQKPPEPQLNFPSQNRVVVRLIGGHCFEEEDDVYNDDLYILYAARDANGNKYTGASELIKGIDEGDNFRFDGNENIVYSGYPGEWLNLGFVAMESEDSHNSRKIQMYWKTAEFAASYIPAYGEFVAYAIRGINLAIKYFDEDDQLAAFEFPLVSSAIKNMSGKLITYNWSFQGRNNTSDYRYRIDFTVEVGN